MDGLTFEIKPMINLDGIKAAVKKIKDESKLDIGNNKLFNQSQQTNKGDKDKQAPNKQGIFSGMFDSAKKGTSKLLSNSKGAMKKGMGAIIGVVIAVAKKIADTLIKVFKKVFDIGKEFSKFYASVTVANTNLQNSLMGLKLSIGGQLAPMFADIYSTLNKMISSSSFKSFIKTITGGLNDLWVMVKRLIKSIDLKGITASINQFVNHVIDFIGDMFDVIQDIGIFDLIKPLIDTLNTIFKVVKDISKSLMKAMAPIIKSIKNALLYGIKWWNGQSKIFNMIKHTSAMLFDILSNAIMPIVNGMKSVFSMLSNTKVGNIFAGAYEGLRNFIMSIQDLLYWLQGKHSAIGMKYGDFNLSNLGTMILDSLKNGFINLKNFITSINWAEAMQTGFSKVANTFNTIKDKFMKVIEKLSAYLWAGLTAGWNGFVNMLSNINLGDILKGIGSGIIRGVTGLGRGAADIFGNIKDTIAALYESFGDDDNEPLPISRDNQPGTRVIVNVDRDNVEVETEDEDPGTEFELNI